jgi:hypothetical protein
MAEMTTVQKDKLMGDLRVVIADAEELLRMTADEAGEGAADIRGRVEAKLLPKPGPQVMLPTSLFMKIHGRPSASPLVLAW